ncbi:MAG TPA: L,D-transpeptidase family protein [Anaerolineales bacterium]|nr:L,D-transpeptidase family protein [Anaerolineales bacterium]
MNIFISNGRLRFLPSLLLIFFCLGAVLILFFFAASPASASINYIFGSPTVTPADLWGYADIPKPTHTSTPLIPPTDLPTETAIPPTETPGTMAMEIIEDTPVPTRPAVEEVAAPAVPSYGGSKYILVDISEQHMYVYEGDGLIYSFVASTGMNNATRVGSFAVQSKIPNAYGATWDIWMPSWLGIYWSGGLENGIHALPIMSNGATLWEGFLGRPISYGCVVLGSYEAQVLYDWAEIGTPVEIQW